MQSVSAFVAGFIIGGFFVIGVIAVWVWAHIEIVKIDGDGK